MKKDVLIAAFPEVADIGKRVASALGAEYTEIYVKDFPDSEFHLKLRKNPKNKKVVIINSITKDPDEKLIETILAAGAAKDYKAKKVILLATYLPYMRQDAHFVNYDSFSAKHILEVFSDFDKIIVIDPHLHRIKDMHALSKKADSISVDDILAKYIKKNFTKDYIFVGPDEESQQWSAKIAKMLKMKHVTLKKTRFDDKNVKIKKQKLGDKIIIVDDIISTGHTIIETIKIAKKQGAKKIVCICIHALLNNNADKFIKKHAQLITTNTIPNKYAKIDVSPAIIERLRKEV